MSVQATLRKINNLLLEIKNCLKTGQFELPLVRCIRQFNFQRKIMSRRDPTPILFKKTSVSTVLRVVQILTIVRNLLLNNKFITKRNLYYQLVRYYPYYGILDGDLLVICDSLKIERSNLNIIVSSKLQLFWFNCVKVDKSHEVRIELSYRKCNFVSNKVVEEEMDSNKQVQKNNSQKDNQFNNQIKPNFIQKQHITLIPHQIFKIPNCPKLQVNILIPPKVQPLQQNKINFLIMQKQSLFEILSQSLTYKLPKNNQNWFLVNSKGYPDMTALQFVNEILKLSRTTNIQFYYIGDYDVYGIDIMLNYAIGNQIFQGLWSRIKWLCGFDQLVELETLKNKEFRRKFQKSEHRRQTVEDKKKTKEMLCRDYFQIQTLKEKAQQLGNSQEKDDLFISKVSKWRAVVEGLLQKDYQCQVESYFKNWLHPFDVIQLMIERKLYV